CVANTTSLLVWTTTPWTLPSNQFVAVNPAIDYAILIDSKTGERLIVAADLVQKLEEKTKRTFTREDTKPGTWLVGKAYRPPFDCYYSQPSGAQAGDTHQHAWRIVAADFVTTDSGTGLVHIAPAFGEDDFNVLQQQRE